MKNSAIEWTHHTFNPWTGCEKVSPACDGCYAESWAKRAGRPELWQGVRTRTTAANWRGPRKWDRDAGARGVRERVFCASLADIFDNKVPPEWRADLFRLIRDTPNLDWLLLTKRIGNAQRMIERAMRDGGVGEHFRPDVPWQNVWLGSTVATQSELTRDVEKLVRIPAAVHFLSMEPLLEAVTFHGHWIDHADPRMHENILERVDWVIVGGESGGRARPMDAEWCLSLRAECEATGTKFFMKQGSAANWPDYKNFETFPEQLRVRELPGSYA